MCAGLTCDQAYIFPSGKALRIKREGGPLDCRLVPLQRAWLLDCFDQKTGVDLPNVFWIGIGYGFRGNLDGIPNEKEKKVICEFEMRKKSYC